ncbi:cell envelope integrity EipB family protein [Nitrospirillum amazonense]|uniref:cell envelope integrity EipB family protein n=1 Tax=Nitrospirillum amazonense TaxID=28077 RepID=UPI002DD443DD|nr:cell envelope integrity EipB family protein [Nitrospirillum amazonense]MEC4594434.1 cell envelope integrity EipB family protein [Nitrospirillum amazonense]
MRARLVSMGLASLAVLALPVAMAVGATPPSSAAPAPAAPSAAPPTVAPTSNGGPMAGTVMVVGAQMSPHRAAYRLTLASSREGSRVTGVVGAMNFAWNDVCRGWTTEQRFQIRFLYSEADDQEMTTSYTTWEAKDGSVYRFNVRKQTTGQPDEEMKGVATLNGEDGGVAHFEKPKLQDIELAPGTVFPTAHTLLLINQARHGDTPVYVRPVFDGSEAEEAGPVSAVIGKAKPLAKDAIVVAALHKDKAWPVHLAFFANDEQQALPDYDTAMMLMDNGIVQSMLIDYGDFKVRAELVALEPLPRPAC